MDSFWAPNKWLVALLVVVPFTAGCSSGDSNGSAAATNATADATTAIDDIAPVVAETAQVSVAGDSIAPQPDDVRISVDASTDPAIGSVAPTLSGTNFAGESVEIGTDGQPTIVFFVTHWCGHCQAEVPEIQDLVDAGSIPPGVRVVAVSTATRDDRDNYPPSAWFTNESWSSDVMLDNETDAMAAFGGTGFPYGVYLDADNTIVARTIGSIGPTQIVQLAERIAE